MLDYVQTVFFNHKDHHRLLPWPLGLLCQKSPVALSHPDFHGLLHHKHHWLYWQLFLIWNSSMHALYMYYFCVHHYGYHMMQQKLHQRYSLKVRRDYAGWPWSSRSWTSCKTEICKESLRHPLTKPCLACWWLQQIKTVWFGCIDSYSCKVLWLVCGASNNDPGVIAQNYLHCVSECAIIPMQLRTDCGTENGTENGTMAAIHCALRSSHTDGFAGAASHVYGSSTTNQRIKSWWSYFRKQKCDPQNVFLHP